MLVKRFLLVGLLVGLVGSTAKADLIGYFNFNGLSIATASAPGAGGAPTSISADIGSATLSLSGWTGLVDDFGGSTINALNSDPAEESLSLVSNVGNGSYIDLTTSLTGFQSPIITFATRGTSTGFDSGLWSYSTDGVNFTASGLPSTATKSGTFALAIVDFTGFSALTDAASATFRYTLTGATSTAGNNRIDNLQLNATPVPDPSSLALVTFGAIGGVSRYRRRKLVAAV